jgi:hypothetical protein
MEEMVTPRPDSLPAGSVATSVKSTVSWPAIIAGAFVAISATLILLSLGSGLGFASISPWADHGVSATTFAVTTAIWLIVTQWISAGLGGYIAGRLRTRWHGTHTHEIFFRDTAHGLVTWAVATVVVAALVGASMRLMMAGGMHAVSAVASASGEASGQGGPSSPGSWMAAYGVDKLLRSSKTTDGGQSAGNTKGEAEHIMAHALATGSLPESDREYLAGVIAATAGTSMADAQMRVDDWLSNGMEAQAKAKVEADAVRKAAAEASIYAALALLIGAFIASVSAALGGRLRDEHP